MFYFASEIKEEIGKRTNARSALLASAAKTDQAFHNRAHKLPSENADEAMKSYAELAQLNADSASNVETTGSCAGKKSFAIVSAKKL